MWTACQGVSKAAIEAAAGREGLLALGTPCAQVTETADSLFLARATYVAQEVGLCSQDLSLPISRTPLKIARQSPTPVPST